MRMSSGKYNQLIQSCNGSMVFLSHVVYKQVRNLFCTELGFISAVKPPLRHFHSAAIETPFPLSMFLPVAPHLHSTSVTEAAVSPTLSQTRGTAARVIAVLFPAPATIRHFKDTSLHC